jgi:hypothetical protein
MFINIFRLFGTTLVSSLQRVSACDHQYTRSRELYGNSLF